MTIQIGTSGWSYGHWDDVLYPAGAPSRERLGYYTRSLTTVELNSSFYRWPAPAMFKGWRRRPPEAFVLSGQGAARPHARQAALRAGGLGAADRRVLARAGRQARGAAGAALA